MKEINIILADQPGLGRVRLCECNSVHLSLGPVTISLEPGAFVQAVEMVRDAMEQLAEITGTSGAQYNPVDAFKRRHRQLTH